MPPATHDPYSLIHRAALSTSQHLDTLDTSTLSTRIFFNAEEAGGMVNRPRRDDSPLAKLRSEVVSQVIYIITPGGTKIGMPLPQLLREFSAKWKKKVEHYAEELGYNTVLQLLESMPEVKVMQMRSGEYRVFVVRNDINQYLFDVLDRTNPRPPYSQPHQEQNTREWFTVKHQSPPDHQQQRASSPPQPQQRVPSPPRPQLPRPPTPPRMGKWQIYDTGMRLVGESFVRSDGQMQKEAPQPARQFLDLRRSGQMQQTTGGAPAQFAQSAAAPRRHPFQRPAQLISRGGGSQPTQTRGGAQLQFAQSAAAHQRHTFQRPAQLSQGRGAQSTQQRGGAQPQFARQEWRQWPSPPTQPFPQQAPTPPTRRGRGGGQVHRVPLPQIRDFPAGSQTQPAPTSPARRGRGGGQVHRAPPPQMRDFTASGQAQRTPSPQIRDFPAGSQTQQAPTPPTRRGRGGGQVHRAPPPQIRDFPASGQTQRTPSPPSRPFVRSEAKVQRAPSPSTQGGRDGGQVKREPSFGMRYQFSKSAVPARRSPQ